jgi:hypothetical protein
MDCWLSGSGQNRQRMYVEFVGALKSCKECLVGYSPDCAALSGMANCTGLARAILYLSCAMTTLMASQRNQAKKDDSPRKDEIGLLIAETQAAR